MPCYSPLQGFRSTTTSANGKRGIVFNPQHGYRDLPVTVPCGQCIGCRLERSRQWAIRCVHEAQMHDDNAFITLTYNDENRPADGSLNLRHFQLFMKRFRKKVGPVRFYHCGEYGEQFGRPHYHAIIFGYGFPDKKLWKTLNDVPLYRSATLEALWTLGFSSIGGVTFQSAAYVARYIMKKVTGDRAKRYYEIVDPETGEVHQVKPEYTTMSRRPGIGSTWLEQYLGDVYPSDEVIIKGKTMRPPKFYDARYELLYPSEHAKMKGQRKRNAAQHVDNNTAARLYVRASVQLAKLNLLPRNLDKDDIA